MSILLKNWKLNKRFAYNVPVIVDGTKMLFHDQAAAQDRSAQSSVL